MTYENHAHIARRALFFDETENTPLGVRKITVESNEGKKLTGVFVGKSIIFPISVDLSSDNILSEMAKENLEVIGTDTLAPMYGAFRILGLANMNNVEGVHADTDFFGTIIGVHLHPNGSPTTEEEFLAKVIKILNDRELKVNVGDKIAM